MKSRNRVLYYGKKAAAFLASVLLLSVLVFYISRLAPGDPLVSYYGDRVEKMTPEERAWAEEKLGLKDPISVQYIRWAGNALHGDFEGARYPGYGEVFVSCFVADQAVDAAAEEFAGDEFVEAGYDDGDFHVFGGEFSF